MALAGRISSHTRTLLLSTPKHFTNLVAEAAAGNNPNADAVSNCELIICLELIDDDSGAQPHHPFTDLEEVRISITVQFNGVPGGAVIAHLFNDGTIKTREQMHAEINRRRQVDQSLTEEESNFPALGHTALRKAAEERRLARIRSVRSNHPMSIMAKQVEKSNAEEEYSSVLRELAEARAVASAARKSKR
ncbi:hypothetical protein LTR53_006751 [Teratosphaeriaceae sp. CCFEE 6253]|nr:hypothetical protein LTR53_006751 [Teratosphaeriaceae sp. CCFEE 6253]